MGKEEGRKKCINLKNMKGLNLEMESSLYAKTKEYEVNDGRCKGKLEKMKAEKENRTKKMGKKERKEVKEERKVRNEWIRN